MFLAALAGLGMTLSAAKAGAESPDADDDTGLTLEWAPAGEPVAGVEQELAYVNSPYPLADLRGDTRRGALLMADTSTLALDSGTPPPVLPRRRELLFGTAFATAGVVMAHGDPDRRLHRHPRRHRRRLAVGEQHPADASPTCS